MNVSESFRELLQMTAEADPRIQAAVISFLSSAARLEEPFAQDLRAVYARRDRAALLAAIEKWAAALPCPDTKTKGE